MNFKKYQIYFPAYVIINRGIYSDVAIIISSIIAKEMLKRKGKFIFINETTQIVLLYLLVKDIFHNIRIRVL